MHIDTVEVGCSTCGANSTDVVGRATDVEFGTCDNEFVFVKCAQCGLVYLRNRPARHMLATIYPPSYYRYAEFLGSTVTRLRGVVQGGRLRTLRRLVGASATIMEVGCGEGQLLQMLHRSGPKTWHVVGVDISPDACAALERLGIEMHCSTFEALTWPDETIDAVIMNQVIEHLEDPSACVRRAAALLRPGGILVVETPSIGSWDLEWFSPDRWGGWHCPRHWSLYTAESLRRLVTQHGLAVETVEYLLSPFIWAHTLQNVFRASPRWRWAARFASEQSIPALMAYGALDTVQRLTTGRTSNMRLVARKPPAAGS